MILTRIQRDADNSSRRRCMESGSAKRSCYFYQSISVVCLLLLLAVMGPSPVSSEKFPGRQQKQQQQQQQQKRNLLRTRIVGGSEANAWDHPYFAEWPGAKCGGAVIHEDFVISAAHCYNEALHAAPGRLYLGSVRRGTGIARNYVKAIVHPKYDPEVSAEYDFVLLKTGANMLVDAAGVDTRVRTIEMNRNLAITNDDSGVIAVGYGQTSEHDSSLSNVLRDVLLYYVDNEYCSNQYPGRVFPDVMFCTGVPGGGKDTCQGDSGGPLIDWAEGTLVGVVSWGEGCAREDYSGVNAKIAAVQSWIDLQICEFSDYPPINCPSKTPQLEAPGITVGESGSPPRPPPGGSGGGPPPGGSGGGPPPGGAAATEGRDSSDPSSSESIPSPLASGGGSSSLSTAETFPGDGPLVATHAITINVFYGAANSQVVTWNFAQMYGFENWTILSQSGRGINNELQSETFTSLIPGVYRFQLLTGGGGAVAINWVSVMAPRGMEVWAKDDNFNALQYDVRFEINNAGIACWDTCTPRSGVEAAP